MDYDENKLYNLALIALFILVIIQLVNMFNSSKKEHMDASLLLNHQYVEWPGQHDRDHIPPPQAQEPKFYEDGNVNVNSEDPTIVDPAYVNNGLPCGPQYNWLVPQAVGANGKYDDSLWNKTSPKMVLRNDCLNCKNYSGDKVFNDSESGLPSMGGHGLLD